MAEGLPDHPGDLLLGRLEEEVVGGGPLLLVEAQVQGAVALGPEAPGGVVELGGADAQVEEHAGRSDAQGLQRGLHGAEGGVVDGEALVRLATAARQRP